MRAGEEKGERKRERERGDSRSAGDRGKYDRFYNSIRICMSAKNFKNVNNCMIRAEQCFDPGRALFKGA